MSGDAVIGLIGAFGLGSFVTNLAQNILTRRQRIHDRNFEEKKAAYVGLLEAYHLAAIERTEVAGKHFAYWQVRCDLVAPAAVREATAQIVATNDNREGRIKAQNRLIKAMRVDLGIGLH
jgi:hypothetical protein